MKVGPRILLLAALAMMGCEPTQSVMRPRPHAPSGGPGSSVTPPRPYAPARAPAKIDDHSLRQRLERAAHKLIAQGKTTPLAALIKQLDRKQCVLRLPRLAAYKMTPRQIYDQKRQSVLVVAGTYKCDRCARWHASTASGFFVTATGAFVTSYHVVSDKKKHTLVGMTHYGAVFPVKEVLAASKEDDVAILQLDAPGATFKPVTLSVDAPVGSAVSVISHPSKRFYVLTHGIVSRYSSRRKNGKKVAIMSITADFARGSSGGPVFNEYGAVVGLVSSTDTVYHKVSEGKKENPQMVFKQCAPAQSVLRLIRQR